MKKTKKEIFENYKKLIDEAIQELKTKGERHKQIPNLLTVSRLFSPFIIIPIAITGNIPLTLVLAASFGLTDFLDGKIARKYNLSSELGKELDAIVDKVFSTTLLLAASFANPSLIANVTLEAVIASINTHQKLNGIDPESSQVGRIKTWALFSLAILGIAVPQLSGSTLINSLGIITAALQGLTISSYLTKENKIKNQETKEKQLEELEMILKVEETKEEKEKQKTKQIENQSPNIIEELKEMSEFLHQEQENQKLQPPQPNIQKLKK